jgi:hypothetical protein
MIRIGLVGPADSMKLIKNVAKDLPEGFSLSEYSYKGLEDLQNLEGFCRDVDSLLFSGPAPYYWVKERFDPGIPMMHIPRNGTCIYKVLFNILRNKGDFSYLSFDTIARKDILEALEELSIPYKEIKTLEYEGLISFEEVTQFHLDNLKQNENTLIITGISGPYKALTSMGIMAYRIHPTNPIIRSSLEKAILYGESETHKESQIALVIIRANQPKPEEENQFDYSYQKQLLDLYQLLLDYSDTIQATALKTGDNEFMLVATRGSLNNTPCISKSLPQYIQANTSLLVSMGIGYGKTARIAKNHARMAVSLSKKNNGYCCYMVTDEGEVIEPQIKRTVNGSNLNQLAKELEISVESLSSIKQALRRLGKSEITSKELSLSLNLSERSARRILSHLEAVGAARVIGNQSIFKKGRPRSVYKVLL